MEKIWHFSTLEEFDGFLRLEGAALARDAAGSLSTTAMMSSEGTVGTSSISLNPSGSVDGFSATVPFMGPVFGEFIISVDRQTAERLFAPLIESLPAEARSRMICEALAETLNQCAGKRMRSFNETFKRMTMSVPKVTEGKVLYRSIRSARTTITTEFGTVEVSLYIDQMKTDLADAHREMIDQLKGANRELERVNRQIKDQQTQLVQSEKMASLGLMAAGVAHEINNPLSFVMANIDTLSAYVEVTTRLIGSYSNFVKHLVGTDQKDALREIEKIRALEEHDEVAYITDDSQKLIQESRGGLDRIRRIVSGLKRFSRQDSTDFRSVQINEEIMNTLELLRNELKYKCKIETDLRSIPELVCLPSELSQVFVNLLMNAAQAMPSEGGTIRIETFDEAGSIVIRFKDNGSGMSNEVKSKLFQPFFTTKPVGKGTGLGLAISFGIVERHGGTIQVESELGKGSAFTIRLPLKAALAA